MTTYTKHSPKNNVPAKNDPDALLTPDEIAQRLRVDVTTVRRWIKNGALEAVKLPSASSRHPLRVKASTLDAMLGEKGA